MAVLVVGGAGYIGSHAAHVLRRKGYDVIIYDNLSTGHKALAEGFELIVGDIGDSTKVAKVLTRCDSVMHFAAHALVGESTGFFGGDRALGVLPGPFRNRPDGLAGRRARRFGNSPRLALGPGSADEHAVVAHTGVRWPACR